MNNFPALFSDSVTFTLSDDGNAYAFWGSKPDLIWRLHLITCTWCEVPCTGVVPAARENHVMVGFAGHLLLFGGEPLVSPAQSSSPQPGHIEYYELVLDTFTWTPVKTRGAVPLNRSHHTCSLVGNKIIMLGGKPVFGGGSDAVTVERVNECLRNCFYDIYIFDVVLRLWQLVTPPGFLPRLWGHSAAVYDERYVLVFGGLDVSLNDATSAGEWNKLSRLHDKPVAVFSDKLYILDVNEMFFSVVLPPPEYLLPPRVFHAAHIDAHNMFVLGGFRANRRGEIIRVNRLYVYNIIEGEWTVRGLPTKLSPALSTLSCIYESQIVLVASTTSLWSLDIHEMAGVSFWRKIPTLSVRAFAGYLKREENGNNDVVNTKEKITKSVSDNVVNGEDRELVMGANSHETPQVMQAEQINIILEEIQRLRKAITEKGSDFFSQESVENRKVKVKMREKEVNDSQLKKERIIKLTERLERLILLKNQTKSSDVTRSPIVHRRLRQEQKPTVDISQRDTCCMAHLLEKEKLSLQTQEKKQDVFSSLTVSDQKLEKWSKVIEILKNFSPKPSSRAFCANVIEL